MLELDGSYGEGGGQILRSSLTLAALTGLPVRLAQIRANRREPGLRPQHVTAVRAAAAICNAVVAGDAVGSSCVTFAPQSEPLPGEYSFDVADAAHGGSAGAVTLILQTLLLPLALAPGPSRLTLRGGTTVPMSPAALYIDKVYLPALFEMGVRAKLEHRIWGFYPAGGGELVVDIPGRAALRGWDASERGELLRVEGLAFASKLPSHIPQRMTNRAVSILRECGFETHIVPQHVMSPGVGTGLFLTARYDCIAAGFLALGRLRLTSEEVAETACKELLAHHAAGAAVDPHLGDQLVLPFALAVGPSRATLSRITRHLITAVWVAHQFGFHRVAVDGQEDGPGTLTTTGD